MAAMADLTPEQHEALGFRALATAEERRNFLGALNVAITGAYASLATAQFMAAEIKRRKAAQS